MGRTTRNLYLSPTLAQIVPWLVFCGIIQIAAFKSLTVVFGQGTLLRVKQAIKFQIFNPCPICIWTLCFAGLWKFLPLMSLCAVWARQFPWGQIEPFYGLGWQAISLFALCRMYFLLTAYQNYKSSPLNNNDAGTRLGNSSGKPLIRITIYSPSINLAWDWSATNSGL